ncbi:hypothetical protein FIBSPDRAFT_375561 [Athelia psychrophila]|uniref:Uncharacterized protein n=1 Tax=Athelia psychrophila TaxID=1759441 RepID=A0A166VZP9_9AGAM|nr:hypothetical protein FIBSPDRAFT_375561 [Fibularhizoctonia sp. CBS 109695]
MTCSGYGLRRSAIGLDISSYGFHCISPCLKPPQLSVLLGDVSTGVTVLSATAQIYPLTRDRETIGRRIRTRGNAIFYQTQTFVYLRPRLQRTPVYATKCHIEICPNPLFGVPPGCSSTRPLTLSPSSMPPPPFPSPSPVRAGAAHRFNLID